MANRRLQVFVSSRMEELAPERQVVKSALNDHEIDAWVFEADAGSRSASIQHTYRRELDEADLYVGLFWKGYGEYTLDEFTYARRQQKDCLIYEKREGIEGKRDSALQAFLDDLHNVKRGLTIRRFHTPEELSEFVKKDIAAWQTDTIRRLRSPGSSAPFQAPPLSDKHVAREAVLAQLKEKLLAASSEKRSITRAALHGTAGAGKSVAAKMFAHVADVAARFPNGALWADVKRALSEAIQLEGRGRVEILASAAAASIRSGDLSTWKEMLSFEDDFEAEKKTALVASHAAVALMDRGATEEAIELARAHVDAARKAIDLRDANEYRTKPASLSRLGLVFARGGHNDEAKRIAVRLRSEPSSGQKEDAILAETWALLGCAPEAVTELIDIDDPETFRRVLRILVEQNASGRAVTDVVRFWSDAVRGIEHRPTRAIMLAKIALVLDGTELRDHATVEVQRVSSLMTPKPKVSQSALASRQRAMPSGRERFRIRNQPNRSSSPRTDKSSLEPPPSSPPVTSPDAGALDDALLVLLPAGTIGTS